MKIAIIAPTFVPSRRANTIQVMKMAQALTLFGHTVHLTAPGEPAQPSRGGKPESPIGADWPDLKHHYGLTTEFPITWLAAYPRRRGYDYAFRAVRWAKSWRANLLYTRHPQTAALGSLLGQPTIFEIHDLPHGAAKILLRAFLAGRGNRRLIAVTHALAKDLSTQYAIRNNLVLSDGVDLARYANLPDPIEARTLLKNNYQLPINNYQLTIGYTGHLYPGRGTNLILALATRLPNFHFLLTGGNPEDVERLQNKISNQQSIINNLTLTGFIPNADLPRYQAACDLFLMPYQRHVAASSGGDIAPYLSPMKLFEYLATGRAILSSDLPVFREVLNPENAVLLPPDDVDAWVDAIRDLHAYPEKRTALGTRARLDAKKYTWEARAEKMLEGLG